MIQPFAQAEFEWISPVFLVSDIRAALAFYCERLGFGLDWTWGDPPTHANVSRGAISITLTLGQAGAASSEVYVGLRGVDAYYAELRTRNVQAGELADRPYGMRDFELMDLDGNRLVFGESIT
jgi:catechol 2,3-dioxygenase-like lactoylglutathione lyase family enzyme